MGWNDRNIFLQLIVGGPGAGAFFYNGPPGPGNQPVLSIVAPGVTSDPYGNPVTAVLVAGNFATGTYTQIDSAGQILIFNAAGNEVILNANGLAILPAGAVASALLALNTLFVANDTVQLESPAPTVAYTQALLNLVGRTGGQGLAQVPATTAFEADGSATVAGGLTADKATIINAGGNPLLQVTNTTSASTTLIRVTLPNVAGQEAAFAMLVTGDAFSRLTLNLDSNNNPRISMGGGAVAPDSIFYRAAANLFASDFIARDNGGVAETWNAVTFANGWANAGLEPGMSFRLVAAPDNCVQVVGAITVPVGFVAGQNITTAMPASYRPAKVNELTVYNANTNAPARITVTTGGIFQYQAGGNAAGNTLIIPAGNLIALTA